MFAIFGPRACFIDNEPDWADKHPLGYRPNRKQNHRSLRRSFSRDVNRGEQNDMDPVRTFGAQMDPPEWVLADKSTCHFDGILVCGMSLLSTSLEL